MKAENPKQASIHCINVLLKHHKALLSECGIETLSIKEVIGELESIKMVILSHGNLPMSK